MKRPEGWDRTDADEWSPMPAREHVAVEDLDAPEAPGVRPWVIVSAFALILLAGVVGIFATTPGVLNGAALLVFLLGAAAITVVVRELRR